MNSRQLSLHTHNLFRGQAGLLVRKIIGSPGRKWTGRELAKELELSQAWVNRVLDHLSKEKFIFRNNQGKNSYVVLDSTQALLQCWLHYYQIGHNPFYFYLKENPLKNIKEISLKENFYYALTGFEAANRIKRVVHNAPPMVYLWPRKNGALFEAIVAKLENVYDFIPVRKKANLIILKPLHKEAVFLDSKPTKGITVVSPVQLFLDLYGLSRGPFIIGQLSDYWKKNNIHHEI